MSYFGDEALHIADYHRASDLKNENRNMNESLRAWKDHAGKLQRMLDNQCVETARAIVMREAVLAALLKIDPGHYLKESENRRKVGLDREVVAKKVAEIGRGDLAPRVMAEGTELIGT